MKALKIIEIFFKALVLEKDLRPRLKRTSHPHMLESRKKNPRKKNPQSLGIAKM